MKKNIMLSLVAAFAFIFVGCQSTNVSQPSSPVSTKIEANLKAEITVGAEISGTSSLNVLFGLIKFGGDSKFADGVTYTMGNQTTLLPFDTVGPVKAAAAYNACTAANADVLVAPRYTVEINDYFVFKTITVTVKGRKGTLGTIK